MKEKRTRHRQKVRINKMALEETRRELLDQRREIEKIEKQASTSDPVVLPDISAQLLSEMCRQIIEEDDDIINLEASEADIVFN